MKNATLTILRKTQSVPDVPWAICRTYLDHSGFEQFSIVATDQTQEQAERGATYYKGGHAMLQTEALAMHAARPRKPKTPQL